MPDHLFIPSIASPDDDLRAAKAEWSRRLIAPRPARAFRAASATSARPQDNVVGVGIGEKYTGGRPTGVPAVKFLVRRKFPAGELLEQDLLPATVDGLACDVEEVGTLRSFAVAQAKKIAPPNPRTRMRPARPGCSVGYVSPAFRMAGTFGALATDGALYYILSNNHVLADEDRNPAGTPILQPGTLDGGVDPGDRVAALTRAVPLQAAGFNQVDAAIAQIDPSLASADILGIGKPAGVGAAQLDMSVHKFGRTTSYTAGRVTSVATDVSVEYDTGVLAFEDQIVIVGHGGSSFSAGGDSGSLILERGTNAAVGLLFAGSRSHTIANHIHVVLAALGIELVL